MESLIVIYLPDGNVPTEKKDRKTMKDNFEKNKPYGSEILLIIDPNRTKVEVEVFFKPE
jgi:hypothetical protein